MLSIITKLVGLSFLGGAASTTTPSVVLLDLSFAFLFSLSITPESRLLLMSSNEELLVTDFAVMFSAWKSISSVILPLRGKIPFCSSVTETPSVSCLATGVESSRCYNTSWSMMVSF